MCICLFRTYLCGNGFLSQKPIPLSLVLIPPLNSQCLHASCARHATRTCSLCTRACIAVFASDGRVGVLLAGTRHLRGSEDAGRACDQNSAYRRLTLIRNYPQKRLPAEACARCTCLNWELCFSIPSVKLASDLAPHMRVCAFEFLVGVPAHPIARASVLSAPVLSHGMPPWGPRTAAGVTPGTSALLADPGSPPMSVGWADQFM